VYRGDYPLALYLASPPALTGTYALIILRVRDPGVYRILITMNRPGLHGGSDPTGEWISASTQEVPG
jgi:hypothetical protein